MKNLAASGAITCAVFAGLVVNSNASNTVTVTDVADWSTTPQEVVTIDTPYIPYDGGAYAGINTLSVTGAGGDDGTYNGAATPLEILSGPGQDYVIDIPGQQANTAPDGAATCELLLVSIGALILARPAILKNGSQRR